MSRPSGLTVSPTHRANPPPSTDTPYHSTVHHRPPHCHRRRRRRLLQLAVRPQSDRIESSGPAAGSVSHRVHCPRKDLPATRRRSVGPTSLAFTLYNGRVTQLRGEPHNNAVSGAGRRTPRGTETRLAAPRSASQHRESLRSRQNARG